ncbi:MAG TPA: C25 family cysteine peptidase [Ignavibacteriaceae bacterium]|nr:C25 family cysteine peptidase [Ignavibacteriaceae bacterium]
MNKYLLIFLSLAIFHSLSFGQNYKVIESNTSYTIIEYDFTNKYQIKDTLVDGNVLSFIKGDKFNLRKPGEPWLPNVFVSLGVPQGSNTRVTILNKEQVEFSNKFIVPTPENDPEVIKPDFKNPDVSIYQTNNYFPTSAAIIDNDFTMRYIRVNVVAVAPFQFNPVTRKLIFNKKIRVRVDHPESGDEVEGQYIDDANSVQFVENNLINKTVAKNWVRARLKGNNPLEEYWYSPSKDFIKIYLKEKGIYKLTFEQLVQAGMPSVVTDSLIAIYCNGAMVPYIFKDVNYDSIFNQGDYIQFVGFPPTPTAYTTVNIYNNSNVYWFTYNNNENGLRFQYKDANPIWYEKDYTSTIETMHYEKDSLYERLGYALNDQRDYWYWGKAASQQGNALSVFEGRFPGLANFKSDSNNINIRVELHGLTAINACSEDHHAAIYLTDRFIGDAYWDGQNKYLFETPITLNDTLNIYPDGNYIKVKADGGLCAYGNDEIRINWFEIDYWKDLRSIGGNHLTFKSVPGSFGQTKFWTYIWNTDTVNIFVPQKNQISRLPVLTDSDKSVVFTDSVKELTEYFCADDNYFLTPDSLVKDTPSDLRNLSNSADYIIIAHPKFKSNAEDLMAFRQAAFLDSSITNPRVKIVYTNEIYDEFSYGLLNPYALKDFVKYAFESWVKPAPMYVILLGDMSYDYRELSSLNKKNYVPSLPYHVSGYGQAVSDNLIVAVSGADPIPDLAIGRLSLESIEEGNILIDKIKHYPADNDKAWKKNILLLSSGMNAEDENRYGFNDANIKLENSYITPNGFTGTKVFRYPNRPEYLPYKGEGPEIRAQITKGANIVNYYGHGGGYQWDLVFTNDDIYALENGGRLPVVFSVTCYTAHFDNQDVFGEQFIKVPNKGAIGFFGSSGLTLWVVGPYINEIIFGEILSNKNYNIGKSIMFGKAAVANFSYHYLDQVTLLTYLGDPGMNLAFPNKPDFNIKSSDINIERENILVNDTVDVKVKMRNFGINFPEDSVTVELSAVSPDTSYIIGVIKRPSFSQEDSLVFKWVPTIGGLFELTAKVNQTDIIAEMDGTDNTATITHPVFDISDPAIISPIDGFSTDSSKANFLIADIGYYVGIDLYYNIQIDTSALIGENPMFNINNIVPSEGSLKYTTTDLPRGVYFWRARIFDGQKYGVWSPVRSFIIDDNPVKGYLAKNEALKTFSTYNINYNPVEKNLILNNDYLPPRPSDERFLEDIFVDSTFSQMDSTGLTAFTTDGTYFYFGNIWYYAVNNNPQGRTPIYKIGTGNNGTVKGKYYGTVGSFNEPITNSMVYCSDGFLYVPSWSAQTLHKINPTTGEQIQITIPDGLIRSSDAKSDSGFFYLNSDGRYVYNLAMRDSLGNEKYVLRIFDPSNNWQKVEDKMLGSTNYPGFSGFFVAHGYIYPYENYNSGWMRRIRLSDGFFEEEWLTSLNFQGYYAWSYDWNNDDVYASVFRSYGFKSKFTKFTGRYTDAIGNIVTKPVGPASKFNSVNFDIDTTNSLGSYSVKLLGYNKQNRSWNILDTNITNNYSLANIKANEITQLKFAFTFVDSSIGTSEPLKFKKINIDYEALPEVVVTKKDIFFTPDSMLQGFPTTINLNLKNIGEYIADSVHVKFFLNGSDSSFYEKYVDVKSDSVAKINYSLETSTLAPASYHKVKMIASMSKSEILTFNNITEKEFYVSRDSTNPTFDITFDGKKIINGDIVSSKPKIEISLKDNSPLPLTANYFTLVYNNVPLNIYKPEFKLDSIPYPNTEYKITWTPELPDGEHSLSILAKDASNNFFDSTSYKVNFTVYNEFDIKNVFNYPNPFKNDTYFTFEMRGDNKKPDEFKIKIYTVAGRLIRDLIVPPEELTMGFNKIYWDGRDNDGDEISNGVYLYKVTTKKDDKSISVIQKLAKVK